MCVADGQCVWQMTDTEVVGDEYAIDDDFHVHAILRIVIRSAYWKQSGRAQASSSHAVGVNNEQNVRLCQVQHSLSTCP